MTTHGTLGLATPWARKAFTDDERREVAALIPVGWAVGVRGTSYGGGRTFHLWLRNPDDVDVTEIEYVHDPVNVARYLARKAQVLA